MFPVAVARAIQLAGQHPAVAAWRVAGVSADGQVAAEFDIRTELPAAWRPRGESPSGVRALETVTLTFLPGYPVHAPHIVLRDNFSRAHPHLNPRPAGWPPEPCIVAGSPRELLQARGIEGFIDQIADWLDAAAMLALNDPEHGWEPVRRDTIDDIMVVNSEGLRAMPQTEAGCAVVQTEYFVRSEAGKLVYFVDHRSCVQISMEGSRFSRGQVLAQLGPLPRRLAVDQADRTIGVEGQRPIAHRLQAHCSNPSRVRAAAAIVDRRQRQKTPALPGIPARLGQMAQSVGVEVLAKRHGCGHGKPPRFTASNQIRRLSETP